MLSINSPRLIDDTSKPLNLEYLYFMTKPATDKTEWMDLTIFTGFREIVVDHATAIFFCFSYCCVTTFLVASDFVFSIETFENELACGDQTSRVRALEVEGNQS